MEKVPPSSRRQQKIHMHSVIRKLNFPVDRLVQHAAGQQGLHVAMHCLHVALDPPRGFANSDSACTRQGQIKSKRLPPSVRNSAFADEKLYLGPCARPVSMARTASAMLSDGVRTSMVRVFMGVFQHKTQVSSVDNKR